jgi:ABC-2 type transport system permease protein
MSQFFGILRHEYRMTVRRLGMWIAYGVLYLFYGFTVISPETVRSAATVSRPEMWQAAGFTLFYINMFMVLLGGILSADRLQRDFRLGVRELQQSTPLKTSSYLLAKYLGVLCGVITPLFLYVICIAIMAVILGAPLIFVGIMLVAFFAMGLPAYAFVTAFSLACPLFMPLRVYQVLFVGYWFWGNYLSPSVFPTISDTLLVPCGKYVLYGFFGGFPSSEVTYTQPIFSQTQAILNLTILAVIIVVVLVVTTFILRKKTCKA